MFEMVYEVDESRKVLFLTNPQAELLASSPATLQKMLDFFELPTPKLMINLIASLWASPTSSMTHGLRAQSRSGAAVLHF